MGNRIVLRVHEFRGRISLHTLHEQIVHSSWVELETTIENLLHCHSEHRASFTFERKLSLRVILELQGLLKPCSALSKGIMYFAFNKSQGVHIIQQNELNAIYLRATCREAFSLDTVSSHILVWSGGLVLWEVTLHTLHVGCQSQGVHVKTSNLSEHHFDGAGQGTIVLVACSSSNPSCKSSLG